MITAPPIQPPTPGLCASVVKTESGTSLPPLPSVESTELTRLRDLIAQAQHELQYAHASNCPLFFVKLAQQKLSEALQ
jgi:hypothetical protein